MSLPKLMSFGKRVSQRTDLHMIVRPDEKTAVLGLRFSFKTAATTLA